MMNSSSSCMDRYGQFMMRPQQVPRARNLGNLGMSMENCHKKSYNSRNDYDENSMSRLAKHAHGAPIIMQSPNRYRKSSKSAQPFEHARNNVGLSRVSSFDEANSHEDAGYHGNGTCLPRIIKPRKRRKKDRKPVISPALLENNSPPFTFTANQSPSGFVHNVGGVGYAQMSDNFKRPAPPTDSLFFNCDSGPQNGLPPSSTSSSPISLSNSSLTSSTSSCSCRLCDPNCKIWAFPLRRSFSDNSAVELDHQSVTHVEARRKDVGVIGSNRVKTGETSARDESSLSLLEMIELSHYKSEEKSVHDLRLRSESSSDSSDSGSDSLLGGFNISDEILLSTLKTVGDRLTSERLNAITQQLSEFNFANSRHVFEVSSAKELERNHLDANDGDLVRIDNLPILKTIAKSMSCDFGRECDSNVDVTKIIDECNYGNLMSPMIVHKQNYGLDQNNNFDACDSQISDGANHKERTLLFDCFDIAWQGS